MEAAPAPGKDTKQTKVPPRQATVTATARLHFGFVDPSGRGEHPFGSFGLSLDRPRTKINLSHAPSLDVRGPETERALRYLKTLTGSLGIPDSYRLHVEEAIPPHAGLGSGTQLALAVGTAFAALEGIDFSPQEIAARLGRGARSGIGIATFATGGAVLDGGPYKGALPRPVVRVSIPSAWRVLLIFDDAATGLAGANEATAFDALPAFPDRESEELHKRIIESALPALARGDFSAFCAQVGYLQAVMGDYFAPLQGGRYSSGRVAETLDWLRARGATGLGQSSWGPTGFAFAPSEAEGEAMLAETRTRQTDLGFELAQGRNEAAIVEVR